MNEKPASFREQLSAALTLALLGQAVVLFFVSRTFYRNDEQTGLPLSCLLCVVSTFLAVALVIRVEDAHFVKTGRKKGSELWSWGTLAFLGVIGFYLPIQLAFSWPLPVLEDVVPNRVGGPILIAPTVVLVLLFSYRAFQSSRR